MMVDPITFSAVYGVGLLTFVGFIAWLLTGGSKGGKDDVE